MDRPTPIGAIGRGLIAGAVGTVAMDAVQYLSYRSQGGESELIGWEFSRGMTWETASAPGQVVRRAVEGMFQTTLSDDVAPLLNNVAHWGYGMAWAAAFGIVEGSLRRPRLWHGLPFAVLVFLSGYAILAPMKLYKTIWEYDAVILARDLSGHIAFGAGVAATYRVLSR